jgi:hypothetical protein
MMVHFGNSGTALAQRSGRANMDTFAATRAGFRLAPRCLEIGDNLTVDAATHHIPGVSPFDFIANPNTARAQDAAVGVKTKEIV